MLTEKNGAKIAYGNLQKINGVVPRWVVDAKSTFGRWNINIQPGSEHGHVWLFGEDCSHDEQNQNQSRTDLVSVLQSLGMYLKGFCSSRSLTRGYGKERE